MLFRSVLGDNKIGIADTTFARVDMAGFAIGVINNNSEHEIERYTVPGVKDLPVACKLLFEKYKCDIVMAFGMAGPEPIDKQCSHEASMGMQMVQVEAGKHILRKDVLRGSNGIRYRRRSWSCWR